jgi:hypothetical protein
MSCGIKFGDTKAKYCHLAAFLLIGESHRHQLDNYFLVSSQEVLYLYDEIQARPIAAVDKGQLLTFVL